MSHDDAVRGGADDAPAGSGMPHDHDGAPELMTIGQAAALDGVTAKALRYYDTHGILRPAVTDPRTGYRYYTADQMHDMDAIRICLDAGVPLESLERHRLADGSLDWRAVLCASRRRVDDEIARLRQVQICLEDYLDELVRKARTPEDGVVRSDLQPTWLLAMDWPHGASFDLKRYLRAMTTLRGTLRQAGLPRLLRRGLLIDLHEERSYAFHQFAPPERPDAGEAAVAALDDAMRPATPLVFNPGGGPAESQVIEHASMAGCHRAAMAVLAHSDPQVWRHATLTEIWGSRTTHGTVRIRLSRHRCSPNPR